MTPSGLPQAAYQLVQMNPFFTTGVICFIALNYLSGIQSVLHTSIYTKYPTAMSKSFFE